MRVRVRVRLQVYVNLRVCIVYLMLFLCIILLTKHTPFSNESTQKSYANTLKCGEKKCTRTKNLVFRFFFFAVVCHLLFYFVCFGDVACRKREKRV